MAVKQVQNALALMEFFAHRGAPASLSEIQAEFGWPRSSTYNILSTLVAEGYMYEAARRGGFYPTRRWMDIGATIVAADPVDAELVATLDELAKESGETAIIAAHAANSAVYIAVRETSAPVRYAARPGMKVPIHAAASGRALLSQMSDGERARLLSGVEYTEYGEGALMSAEEVEAEIQKSRTRGWFQSLREYNADLVAVAVPIHRANRRLALVLAGPISRLGERCEEIAGLLRRHV